MVLTFDSSTARDLAGVFRLIVEQPTLNESETNVTTKTTTPATTKSTSDKWNQSVAKATGQEVEGNDGAALPMAVGVTAMISTADDAMIQSMMSSGELEFAPQVLTLEEGQKISGILQGHGPMAEIMDPVEKTTKEVDTWIITSPDGSASVSILDSAQLSRKLPPFIGSMVHIIRGKDLKTGAGRRVTDYLVAGPKLASGQRRQFAVLPAVSTQAALPAGDAIPAATNHASAPAA